MKAFRFMPGRIVQVALLSLLLTTGPAKPQAEKPARPANATLRVGLWTLWHDKEITIESPPEAPAALRLCETCAARPLKQSIRIKANGNGLSLANGREAPSVRLAGAVTLTAHGETITVRNPVRIGARGGELVLAVTLPIESYVERVVASESGPADSAESRKALAVVVRSFALHQAHGHPDYDLCDSTHCQFLHWAGHPQPAAHAATLATAGETLWFHGQRAAAWFHQNCGGRSATPAELWPNAAQSRALKPMPWLASRIDTYCTAGGAREWSANLSVAEISVALSNAGLVPAGWKTLTVARRGESGRAVTLLVGTATITAEDFRLAVGRTLGWNRILSTWFEVSQQGDRLLFHGRGSGHGVGLCQAGAAAMATRGHDSAQILAQYFPGAIVADEVSGRSWQTLRGQGFALETLNPADAAYLPLVNQAFAEAVSRSGIQPSGPIAVRAFVSTPSFRDATLAPGWVAAFTEGNWIATQPLNVLAARKLLTPILEHEFLHALVETHAAPNTPLWLREGLVEAWNANAKQAGPSPGISLGEVDRALAHAATENESATAHRAAGWYARQLIDRYGSAQTLNWLRNGLPASVVAGLK